MRSIPEMMCPWLLPHVNDGTRGGKIASAKWSMSYRWRVDSGKAGNKVLLNDWDLQGREHFPPDPFQLLFEHATWIPEFLGGLELQHTRHIDANH